MLEAFMRVSCCQPSAIIGVSKYEPHGSLEDSRAIHQACAGAAVQSDGDGSSKAFRVKELGQVKDV